MPDLDMNVDQRVQDSETIERYRSLLEERVRDVVPRRSGPLLLAPPHHLNVGDSAIWAAQGALLRSMGERSISSDTRDVYEEDFIGSHAGHPILLSGGGDIGDVWPRSQAFRERIIADFPDRTIVQLPQSVHFGSESALQAAGAVFEGHPDLVLMVRDRQSLALVRERFAVPAVLCPDMAFALGPLRRPRPPITDIVWLGRSDVEARHAPHVSLGEDAIRFDWVTTTLLDPDHRPRLGVTHRVNRRAWRYARRHPRARRMFRGFLSGRSHALAREHLRRGCDLLAAGRVAITDRLHGHILCVLMGIPHVVLDNSYGKVRSFYETWTSGFSCAHWADSPQEALDLARELVRGEAG